MADAETAYDRAFKMLDDVLKTSGSSFDGVVDITTFHTDLPAQFDGFRRVKDRYIREPFPAWTAIRYRPPGADGGLVEIKFVARKVPKHQPYSLSDGGENSWNSSSSGTASANISIEERSFSASIGPRILSAAAFEKVRRNAPAALAQSLAEQPVAA